MVGGGMHTRAYMCVSVCVFTASHMYVFHSLWLSLLHSPRPLSPSLSLSIYIYIYIYICRIILNYLFNN